MPRLARIDARPSRLPRPVPGRDGEGEADGGQAPGILRHTMIRGIERRNIFRDNKDPDNFIKRRAVLLSKTQTACYAWVLMPNHVPLRA